MNKLPPKHIASLIPACCHPGNNRVDVGTNGAIWQAMDYYPFGLTMASSYLPGRQRWLFGGKELDRTSGLELFDFEARAYDPATGRFRQPDPLAEKYYPLSSYFYCAANPMINIDPTGEDYKVSVENDKIVISANIYTVSRSMESAQHAAKIWNDQSKVYALDGLTVEFNINVVVVDPEETPLRDIKKDKDQKALNYAANGDSESIGNTYLLVDNLDSNTNGSNTSGNLIEVKTSRAMTTTAPHELGHGLGLGHYDTGLMTPSSSDENRSYEISGDMIIDIIIDIIKGAVTGKPGGGKDVGKGRIEYKGEQVKFKYDIKKNK